MILVPPAELRNRLAEAREALAASPTVFTEHAGARLETSPAELGDWLLHQFEDAARAGEPQKATTGLYVEGNRFEDNTDSFHLDAGLTGPPPPAGTRTVISEEFDREVGEYLCEVVGSFALAGIEPLLATFAEHGGSADDAHLATAVVRLDLFRLLDEAHAIGGVDFRLAAALHDEMTFAAWPPAPPSPTT